MQLVTTQCWIDGSPRKTGSSQQMQLNCEQEVLMDDTLQQSTMTIGAPFSVLDATVPSFVISLLFSGLRTFAVHNSKYVLYVVSEVWEFALLVIYIYIRSYLCLMIKTPGMLW
jgi:hypothetical protein